MSLEGFRESGQRIGNSLRRHRIRYGLAVSLTGAALLGAVAYEKITNNLGIFSRPGVCSESANLIHHPGVIPESYDFTADNTSGGLLSYPVRSLFATEAGIFVGQASNSAPDSQNPINPVRLLTAKGWEVCNAKDPIKGSVNAVYQNPETREIYAVKDTKDPKLEPGAVVSVFDGKRWTHFNEIPGVLDHRAYAVAANGPETWVGTFRGVAVRGGDKSWRSLSRGLIDEEHVGAIALTFDSTKNTMSTEMWFGLLDRGLRAYPVSSEVTEQPGVPKNVRTLAVSPDLKKIYAGGDPGFGYFDKDNSLKWNSLPLPDGANRIMAIGFNPYTEQPCVAALDEQVGGAFCWNGSAFTRVSNGPSLSLVFGQPGSRLEGKLFIGRRNGTLVQLPSQSNTHE